MSIVFETGDIFSTNGIYGFAHGCNCAGAMGKGIAVSFRTRWPAMYQEYRRQCNSGDFKLGDVLIWEEDKCVVYNLGTQLNWKTKAQIWAIENSLSLMIGDAESRGLQEIALPRIGSGLGGLAWADVRQVIEDLAKNTSINLRVCETFVAGQSLASGH